MKRKLIKLLAIAGILLALAMTARAAWAADVTLTWQPVDFAGVGSDPAQSGYRLYVSYDDGATKTQIGSVGPDVTTFGPHQEPGPGSACYFATAYNQVAESGFSEAACGWIGTGPPPIPTGLEALLQQIIGLLGEIRDRLG